MDKEQLKQMAIAELGAYINRRLCDGFNLYAPHIDIKRLKSKDDSKIVLKIELETNDTY